MKALNRVILFGRVTHNKRVHLWPVAVFPNDAVARAYATFLRLANRSKDDDSIAQLDPRQPKDDEGKPLYDTKWSIVTVPYDPSPAFDDDDDAVTDETPTE